VDVQTGPGIGQQASDRTPFSTHQIWPTSCGLPDPVIYQIRLDVDEHRFTSSNVKVQPIDADGRSIVPPDGVEGLRSLPASTIYGFNGTRRSVREGGRATFPGPMIRAEYGRPVLVRFENHLDDNDRLLPRGDFGAPGFEFMTHLHTRTRPRKAMAIRIIALKASGRRSGGTTCISTCLRPIR
jgi:hypothetical protein